jgi:hypothetical protein
MHANRSRARRAGAVAWLFCLLCGEVDRFDHAPIGCAALLAVQHFGEAGQLEVSINPGPSARCRMTDGPTEGISTQPQVFRPKRACKCATPCDGRRRERGGVASPAGPTSAGKSRMLVSTPEPRASRGSGGQTPGAG